MLDYKSIRARYELAIRDALLPLSVPLHYDNVQEQPIPTEGSITEYATITISFPSSTEPDICGGVVFIRGNVQVNMYAPRMGGMMRLEQMAAAVVCALMTISDYPILKTSPPIAAAFKDQHRSLAVRTHRLQRSSQRLLQLA